MKKLTLFTALLSILLSSCSEDPEPIPEPENKAPIVSFISPTGVNATDGTIWNTITVEVQAEDGDGSLESVEFFMNGESQGLMTQKGTTSIYTADWNSKNGQNGSNDLYVIATDNEGEKTQVDIVVEVNNQLINFNLDFISVRTDGDMYERPIYLSQIAPNFKFFVFVTSLGENPEIVHVTEVPSLPFSEEVVRPEGLDDTDFDIHTVLVTPDAAFITSFHHVPMGDFMPFNDNQYGEEVGNAKIEYIDVPEHDHFTAAGSYGVLAEGNILNVDLYDNLSMNYVYIKIGSAGYYLYEENLAEGAIQTSLAQMEFSMDSQTFTAPEDIVDGEFSVFGSTSASVNAPKVSLFSYDISDLGQGKQISYHTPKLTDTPFDHFASTYRTVENDKYYYQESYTGIISDFGKLNVEFTIDNKKFSSIDVSATGDAYDVFESFAAVTGNNNHLIYWNSFSDSPENMAFPPIPIEISNQYSGLLPSGFVDKAASVLILSAQDYDHLDGYSDYLSRYIGRDGVTLKEEGTGRKMIFEVFF